MRWVSSPLTTVREPSAPARGLVPVGASWTYEGTEEIHTLIVGQAITGLRAFD